MSIFGGIFGKIFGHKDKPAAQAAPAPAPTPSAAAGSAAGAAVGAAVVQQQAAQQPVDVEAVLTQMAATKPGHGGNWRTSIVDLLKLLDLDSSLTARKELAEELGVHAGDHGSAEQNIALSKAVWKKLAENGGKVPDSLKD